MINFPKVNLYQQLDLPNFSSLDIIKKRYRELILIHHPDRGGKTKEAQAINNIYEILTKYKQEYDSFLRQLLVPRQVVSVVINMSGWTYYTGTNTSANGGTWY